MVEFVGLRAKMEMERHPVAYRPAGACRQGAVKGGCPRLACRTITHGRARDCRGRRRHPREGPSNSGRRRT